MAQYAVDIVAKVLGGTAVDQLARSTRDLGDANNSAQGSVDKLAGKLGSLAAQIGLTVGVAATLKSSLDAAFAREGVENRLQSLTSSSKEFEQSMVAAEVASKRFGTTQTESANALGDIYGRLKGLGLNLAQVNQIYTGFNVIAREARVSTEDAAGAFLQLSQAMGSGKLQGDELKLILERMPQLAQAIADGMGVSAGSIRQLASDGKIGLTEIQTTLATAAQRADQLGKTFTGQQATMAQVRQRWEEVQVAIGQALAPAYLAGLNTIGKAAFYFGEYMKGAAKYVKENAVAIERFIGMATEFAKIAAAVWLITKAYQAWQMAAKAVAVAQSFIIGMTGKGLLLVAAGAAAAVAAYAGIGKVVGDVAAEIQKMEGESEKAYQARKAQLDAEMQMQLAVGQAQQTSLTAKELEKQKLSEIKAAVDEVRMSYELQNVFLDRQTQALQSRQQLVSAQGSLEQALNNELRQRLEYDLENARSLDQRRAITQALLANELEGAKLKTEAQKAENLAALAGVNIEKLKAEIMLSQYQMQLRLTAAKGGDTTELEHQVLLQQQVVGKLGEQAVVAEQLLQINNSIADSLLRQAQFAAQVTAEKRAQQGIGGGGGGGIGGGGGAEAENRYLNAMIHRGGSDPNTFLSNWNRMSQSERNQRMASTQVNVNYNGTTVRMGGQDYISRRDVPGIVRNAVDQTITTLSGSPRARRSAGI